MAQNGRLVFEEEKHEYFYEVDTHREKFTSMTTILALVAKSDFTEVAKAYYLKFASKQDNFMSMYKDIAKKNNKTVEWAIELVDDITIVNYKSVMAIWDKLKNIAAKKGTAYHKKKEDESYEKGYHPILTEGTKKVGYNLANLNGSYTELMVYNPFYKSCGTADVGIFKDKKFVLKDYKTSKARPSATSSFNGDSMNSPLGHLKKNDFYKFSLQMSGYAFMLEDFGYECENLIVEWVKDTEKDIREEIEVPYLKKEAKTLLEYHKSLLKK